MSINVKYVLMFTIFLPITLFVGFGLAFTWLVFWIADALMNGN